MTTPHVTPTVFLDTETDGLHDARQAWEIGMIRVDERGEFSTSFFLDIDLEKADLRALQVGRYYERHPYGQFISGREGRPTASTCKRTFEAAEIVAQWTHDAIIVGAVPSFDAELLARQLRHCGFCPAWNHRLVCVESLAAGRLGRLMTGLRASGDALGIDTTLFDLHTALGDAQLAKAIFDRLMTTQPKEDLDG